MIQKDYIMAAEKFKNALKLQPDHLPSIENMAICYIQTKNFEESARYLNKLIEKNHNPANNKYRLAICKIGLAEYDTARIILYDISKNMPDKTLRKEIRKRIEDCEFALVSIKDPKSIDIIHLPKPINDVHTEFSPYFINDTLVIYAQVIAGQNITYSIYDTTPLPTSKLYYLHYRKKKWVRGESFSSTINRDDVNTGNGSFSLDKKRFYFNSCYENWMNKTICEIYVSEYKNNQFSTPYKPGNQVNKKGYTSSHPTAGSTYKKNLEVIYFSSDRPGGKGGMDIWYTVYNKKTGQYTSPQNIGSKINTDKDEVTPFYNNITKTLYYSSNGKTGMGGFDVYKATGELKRWLPAKNMGYPFNTNADDLYFTNNEKQNKGFFVSNRQGSLLLANEYCCYDLFYFTYKELEQITLKGKLEANIDSTIQKYFKKGIVFRNQDSILDEMSKYYENTIVSLYVQNTEENDSIYITSDTASNIGEYLFSVEKDQDYNLVFHDETVQKGQINVSTDNNEVINNEIKVNPLRINIVPEEALIIKNIYYDFDKSELNERSKNVLDSTLIPLLKEKPEFSIEISSHTDSVGDIEYNMELSEKRADNVAFYLISKGIDRDRLQTAGYGEKIPIAPNSHPDGSDNPGGRELNRRTEFRILTSSTKSIHFR